MQSVEGRLGEPRGVGFSAEASGVPDGAIQYEEPITTERQLFYCQMVKVRLTVFIEKRSASRSAQALQTCQLLAHLPSTGGDAGGPQRPQRVSSRHRQCRKLRPLYTRKRTSRLMSLCLGNGSHIRLDRPPYLEKQLPE